MKTILKAGVISIFASSLLFGHGHGSKFDHMYTPSDSTYESSDLITSINDKLSTLKEYYDTTTSDEVATFMYQYYDTDASQEELLTTLSTTLEDFYSDTIDSDISATLLELYELERFAKDIYSANYSNWGLELFNTVSATQDFNLSILQLILDHYSIEYTSETGVYSDTTLQSLYTEYSTTAATSINDALNVSVLVEEKLNTQLTSCDDSEVDFGDDVRIVCDIVTATTLKHTNSFNIALGNDESTTLNHHGVRIDNGSSIYLKDTQLAQASIKKGWNMLSIPVTTATDITSLLPEDATNSIIWTYDADAGWTYSKIELNDDGTLSQTGYIQIAPFQGFWIYSDDDFQIETYVTTDVETATETEVETPPAIAE
jgi:hypothetical protein